MVDIPSIEARKTLIIVVKNNKNFTMENNLLKMPATAFLEKSKK